LYGLKQAPRLWYKEINYFLLTIGFGQSTTNPNLYIKPSIFLLLYVDDLLIVCSTNDNREMDVKKQLQSKYRMADLGKARRFLGLEIEWLDDGTITLSQQNYIDTIVKRFGMEDSQGHN